MYYAAEVIEKLKKSKQIAIFGAGLVAYEAANCLMGRPYQLKIDCFLVSEYKDNPQNILGIPVIVLNDMEHRISKDAVIIVSVMEKHLQSILEYLSKYNFVNIIPLTFESDLWSLMQGNYYREYCLSQNKRYRMLEEELEQIDSVSEKKQAIIHIYTVKCHIDRELREDTSGYFWEIPIQAGAALTQQKICEISDDQGDNISAKNKQYCELTALYWIWKNDFSDYIGLCHYRRHFELNQEMLNKLVSSEIDVVLTIPILNFPNVKKVYEHDHVGQDWAVMMDAIHSLAPDYVEAAKEIQDGNFYYGYNMLIARKEILNSYCSWLFPILLYCEEHCGEKDNSYQGRYIGFLAERLLSIYFLKHENEFKIVHGRKHFIEG